MTDSADIRLAHTVLQFIRPALLEAGRMALALHSELDDARIKTDETPVTKADEAIETLLVGHIRREFPRHYILAEEGSMGGNDAEFMWVIDPLDGTRAYVSGLPVWGISVGLLKKGKPLVGAFYMPAVNELYEGHGENVTFNGQPLPPPTGSLSSRFAFLAVPSNCHLEYDISFGRLRSLGSTAAHLIYVMRGAAVGALTRQVRVWDIAGVLPMLWALGIELRYLSGAHFHIAKLLDGRRAPEPILVAPANVIDHLQGMIHPRTPAG